ncbi:MAG: PhnD/SsuA/transferrin family substrate-binding protein [Pseudomonadota bacterium]
MTAALPMYDLPARARATDALYAAVRRAAAERGIALPAERQQGAAAMALARARDTVLTQTCGFPFAWRGDPVRPVTTPAYAAPGCDGPLYRSAIVARTDGPARLAEAAGARVAVNEALSQSGHQALRLAVAVAGLSRPGGFLGPAVATGSHAASLDAVREGRADLAAIDAVTLALIHDTAPWRVAGLVAIGWSAARPGLPLVTALGAVEAGALSDAFDACLADPALAETRAVLRLVGAERLPASAYAVLAGDARWADAAGEPWYLPDPTAPRAAAEDQKS